MEEEDETMAAARQLLEQVQKQDDEDRLMYVVMLHAAYHLLSIKSAGRIESMIDSRSHVFL